MKSIDEYCLLKDQLSEIYVMKDWGITWPEFIEKARKEFNEMFDKCKYDKGMMEYDGKIHHDKKKSSETQLKNILIELDKIGERIYHLKQELYNNVHYIKEVEPDFRNDIDNKLFKIQSDIRYHIVEDVKIQSLIDLEEE